MNLLKQSTAITIKMGPFLDEDDGKTAETALTIAQAEIRLSKNGGNFAQKGDTGSATHDEIGFYDVSLNTTDTGTLGRLLIAVHESGALPVWVEYMVVPANVYDSLVSGSDNLEVEATIVSDKTGYGLADDAITAAKFDESTAFPLTSADSGSTEVARTGADGDTLETLSDEIDAIPTTAPLSSQQTRDAMKLSPTAGAPATGSVDEHLDNIPTTAAPTASAIATQVDTTLTASHGAGNWTTGAGGSAPTADEIADAVWDEARSAHTTAGSFGEGVRVESLNTQAKADVNTEADTALSDYDPPTKAELDTGLAGLNDISPAEVNAEVDTALADYDAPTKAEMDAGFSGLNDPTAAAIATQVDTTLTASHGAGNWTTGAGGSAPTADEIADAVWDEARSGHVTAGSFGEGVKVESLNTQAKADVNAEADTALSDYDPPTKAELDTGLAGLNDISPAEVNAEVDTALADYDPPTKAELDAGLAGLNDISQAEVNAEVDTALADYDPPTKAEMDAGFSGLNDPTAAAIATQVDTTLTASHGAGNWTTGAGGSAPTAAAVAAEVDTVLTASHGSGSWSSGAAGSGARTVTVTVQDSVSSAKIQGATVRMTAAGQPDAVGTTDENGQVELSVDDATYTITATAKSGYNGGSISQVVDGPETPTINLVAISITAPGAPGLCTVAAIFRQNGELVEGATFQAELIDKNSAVADTTLSLEPVSAKTDSNGRAELQLVRADQFTKGTGTYHLRVMDANGNISIDKKAAIPNADTAFLEDIL